MAAAQTVVTETSPGVDGEQIAYDVTGGAYALPATTAGIEADYTTSTDGSSTTFTFLVRIPVRLTPLSRQFDFRTFGYLASTYSSILAKLALTMTSLGAQVDPTCSAVLLNMYKFDGESLLTIRSLAAHYLKLSLN